MLILSTNRRQSVQRVVVIWREFPSFLWLFFFNKEVGHLFGSLIRSIVIYFFQIQTSINKLKIMLELAHDYWNVLKLLTDLPKLCICWSSLHVFTGYLHEFRIVSGFMLSPLFVAHMYHMSIFIFVHQDGEGQYVIIRGRGSVVVKSTPNYVVNNYEC